jgi:hypothetical protein
VREFAQWLAETGPSLAIKTHPWVVPTIQSIHIVAIGVVVTSVFMIDLRIFGWAGRDQTLAQTAQRFGSWLWGALAVLLATGALMVLGEPVRELMATSFWVKMSMLLVGITIAIAFQTKLEKDQTPNKGLALLTLFVWCSIIVLGRLIAYDNVWGSWSLGPRA